MIHLFRICAPLFALYALYLFLFNFTAGMLPIWLGLSGFSAFMSFQKTYDWFMDHQILKGGLFLTVILVFVIECMIIYTGTRNNSDTKVDYIVVLGAKVNGETMSLSLYRRAEKALEYLNDYPEAIAVLSGGQGPDEGISEAEAMRRYLARNEIPESRIIIEDQSTSTIENIDLSLEKIYESLQGTDTKKPRIAVVTNRFHIFRSKIIGWKKGYDFVGLGARSFPLLLPNYYLREFFAVVVTLVR